MIVTTTIINKRYEQELKHDNFWFNKELPLFCWMFEVFPTIFISIHAFNMDS